MPGGDGTGPLGEGPMTGGRFGYCAGYPTPGGVPKRGRGGFGRGWRRRNIYRQTGIPGWQRYGYAPADAPVEPEYAPVEEHAPEQQLRAMKNHAENLRKQLEMLEAQIDELESDEDE